MVIRRARMEDVPKIMKMKRADSSERFIYRFERVKRGHAEYLIAEIKGEIVGNVFLKFYGKRTAPDYPDIEDLYVREDIRGNGIGTKLLKSAEDLAALAGYKKVGLSVDPVRNPKARDLYKRLGYREVQMNPYQNGIREGLEEWVIDMVKELPP